MRQHYKLWTAVISHYFIGHKHNEVKLVLTRATSSDDTQIIVRIGFILIDGCDGEHISQSDGSGSSLGLLLLGLRQVCRETTGSEYEAIGENVHL